MRKKKPSMTALLDKQFNRNPNRIHSEARSLTPKGTEKYLREQIEEFKQGIAEVKQELEELRKVYHDLSGESSEMYTRNLYEKEAEEFGEKYVEEHVQKLELVENVEERVDKLEYALENLLDSFDDLELYVDSLKFTSPLPQI